MATRWRWPPESWRGVRSSSAQFQDGGGTLYALVDLGLGETLDLQAIGHVLVHRHVRIERIVLEHHGDVALLGFQVIDHAIADDDLSAADLLQPCDHAQQRGLAAAEGPTMTMNSPSAISASMPWITSTALAPAP
jgi:hypothetical protein